jgi:hypothetical protein
VAIQQIMVIETRDEQIRHRRPGPPLQSLPMKLRRYLVRVATVVSVLLLSLCICGYERSLGARELFAIDETSRFFLVSDSGYLHIGRSWLFDARRSAVPVGTPTLYSDRLALVHQEFAPIPTWASPMGTFDWWFPDRIGVSHNSITSLGPPPVLHDATSLDIPYWIPILLALILPMTASVRALGRREQRRLARQLPRRACLRCGYDLSMTPIDSRCPECGLAAERSVIEHVHPDDCPPRWVWMIANATLMLLVAYLAVAAFFALNVAKLEWALFLTGRYFFSVTSVVMALPAAFAFLLLAVIVHAAANILLSREDRRRSFSWWSFLHRWSLRILPLPPLAGAALALLEVCSPSRTPGSPLDGWLVPLCLPLLVCPALTFFRLRWLAIRLGRRRLAEHISIVASGAVVSLLFLLLSSWIAADHFRRADAFFFVFGVLPFGLVALFNLWALLLLFVVTRQFFRSAREATARWRAADAARNLEVSPARAD